MLECSVVRERMPVLLTEGYGPPEREETHQHIETCSVCEREWADTKETWRLLAELPEIPVPAAMRDRFVEQLGLAPKSGSVVPFRRRPAAKWLAQAAAVVMLVGGSFFAGNRMNGPDAPVPTGVASNGAASPFHISESIVLPASAVAPEILGRPQIENVRFIQPVNNSGNVGIEFDMKSRVTVTGSPQDSSFVNLLSYVMQDRTRSTHSRSDAIQWVKDNYSADAQSNPQLVSALANVLRNDTHEGVRLKAIDTLGNLPIDSAPAAQTALMEALKNDPNPAVRMKAVDALMNYARTQQKLDATTVDTLRQKASQPDENPYVRVKAAEALSQISL